MECSDSGSLLRADSQLRDNQAVVGEGVRVNEVVGDLISELLALYRQNQENKERAIATLDFITAARHRDECDQIRQKLRSLDGKGQNSLGTPI